MGVEGSEDDWHSGEGNCGEYGGRTNGAEDNEGSE
jgi:hypothetical protein